MTSDDVEMSEELYQHYSAAPVTAWVIKSDMAECIQSKFSSKAHVIQTEDLAAGLIDAINHCSQRYNEIYENDVKTAFAKFDQDGSGAIDKNELAQLSKDLGFELTEEQASEALRDLDLNNDGVVDLHEFKRWYFTGMKPYNGTRRTMLKAGHKAKALMDVLSDETKNVLMSQELKTKTSKISVGFNVPAEPQTTIKVTATLGGQSNYHKEVEMRTHWDSAIHQENFDKFYKDQTKTY